MELAFRTFLSRSNWPVAVLLCLLAGAVDAQEPSTTTVDFAREILPVLSNKCFVCHGPDGKEKDVLRLDSFPAATRDLGGHRAIDPEDIEQSEILARIQSADNPMPPADVEKQLTHEERRLLTRWIREGGQYATHWSFIAPRKDSPGGSRAVNGSQVIDDFVHARLQQQGVGFAPQADRATLARRVAIVLTGLPPAPEQLARFLDDDRPDAYQRLVDELLNSSHFGEHQARYWLDAVRYGDTHGLHLDNRRAIFPYRDWVIRALNNNLPWDRFITWQLAGDLLPNPTLEQRVATGFVRMNPSTAEGGAIPAEFQAKNNFDRVETFGTVFLGMSLTCARCHTHKYDPVPQLEYYRLLAFFNSTAEEAMDGNKYEYAPTIQAPASLSAWTDWNELESRRGKLLGEAETFLPPAGADPARSRRWRHATSEGKLEIVADADGPFATFGVHQRAVNLRDQMAKASASFATTLVAQERPAPRSTHVLERGEYNRPIGEPLEPGVLTILGPLPDDAPGNRLGLARWLTSREHPLVSRVLVNRFWQRTFGQGLVRTPEDFGLQGEQPTHPGLLDWLAVELHDCGWDLKHMLRIMVNSRTFRQRSAWRNDVDDPENRLLARGPRHRLDAEVIRDIALRVSGLLDSHMGGEGAKPYQPKGLWSALMHPSSNTRDYVRDQGNKLYRRSLYVYWKRTCPHPMLTLFDAPSRESSCVRRSRTNTSLQSLGLLNETQRIEMSRMLAERLLHSASDDAARLKLLFVLLACREPTAVERAACTQLLQAMRSRYESAADDAKSLLSIGDSARDLSLAPAEHAAWMQVAATVLASDLAIMLY